MKKHRLQLFLCGYILISSYSANASELCLRSASAGKPGLIYLHGLDAPSMSPSEKTNREVLLYFHKKTSIGVFAPRAKKLCRGAELCWPHADKEERSREFTRVIKEATRCFGGKSARFFLGFSNGAYLAAKWHEDCLIAQNKLVIVSGGLGSKNPKWPLACSFANLEILIGKKDITLRKAQNYASKAENTLGELVNFSTHPLGHTLELKSLVSLIQKFSQ